MTTRGARIFSKALIALHTRIEAGLTRMEAKGQIAAHVPMPWADWIPHSHQKAMQREYEKDDVELCFCSAIVEIRVGGAMLRNHGVTPLYLDEKDSTIDKDHEQ